MKMNKPTALYIHIPFCQHICDYCDFPKLQYFRNFAINYINSLKNELQSYDVNQRLETIYIGGGTPTELEDDLFEELLMMVYPYAKDALEYTIEANPESLSLDKLKLMKRYGVNRLSIGVESTDDKILKAINRHHTFEDVQIAVSNARKVGFDNLNVDLIIGLPNVLKNHFKKDLQNIVNLNIEHISCYSLTVHPHTAFFNKGIEEPKDEYSRELYDLAESFLKENGYIHYEISNWSKPDRYSRHNMVYWRDGHYYGLGLGAAGYIGNVRYTNTRNLEKYNRGEYLEEKEIISLEDDKTYFIMLNLRTIRGIYFKEYQDKFNEDFLIKYNDVISGFIKDKLLVLDLKEQRIYPSYDGMMVLDQIILALLGE